MDQLHRKNQKETTSRKTKITIVLALMGLGVVLMIAIAAILSGGNSLSPAFLAPATQTQPLPTLFIPTPDCGSSTLVIGPSTFQIQTIPLAEDGTVSVPPDGSGVAYWVEGTDLQYTFQLSPTPENVALVLAITEGITARTIWSNCNSMTFELSAPQPGSFGTTYLPVQSTASIAIFVQDPATGSGYVLGGGLTEEQISTFDNPTPASGEIQAEIGLLETTSDGDNLQLTISIYNYGNAPITLSAGDVSLTQSDGTPLPLVSSGPTFAKEIASTATETFIFTFPRPTTPSAVLKVFTVEYDVEGY